MTPYTVSEVEPRIYLKETANHPYHTSLSSPEEVLAFMQEYMADLTTECILVFNLDNRNNVINFSRVGIGTAKSVFTTGREIFKTAILSNACSIILCHNHLSNDPSPSKSDVKFTRYMYMCSMLLGIPLIDHIIVTPEKNYYSFVTSLPSLFTLNDDTSAIAAEGGPNG